MSLNLLDPYTNKMMCMHYKRGIGELKQLIMYFLFYYITQIKMNMF